MTMAMATGTHPSMCSEAKALVKAMFPPSDEEAQQLGMDHMYQAGVMDIMKDDAVKVMEACIAAMMVGFMAPFRPMCLRTLKAPEYWDTPCQFKGCKIRGCHGNYLRWEKIGGVWRLFFR